jgi:hypothetical protein
MIAFIDRPMPRTAAVFIFIVTEQQDDETSS